MSATLTDSDYDAEVELARRRLDGSLIRAKARVGMEAFVLPRLIEIAMDKATAHKDVIEIGKLFGTLGDLNPKAAAVVQAPALNIQFIRSDGILVQPGSRDMISSHQPTAMVMNFDPMLSWPPMPVEAAALPFYDLSAGLAAALQPET